VDPLGGISDATRKVLQTGTENAYRRFLNLVARGRDLSLEQVAEIAEGRVWLGTQALDLGLVDALGDQEAAIARAAELAGLEDYGVQRIETPLTTQELLLRRLFSNFSRGGSPSGWLADAGSLPPLMRHVSEAWRMLQSLNDPRHSYALCLACNPAW
jgi:protease-4